MQIFRSADMSDGSALIALHKDVIGMSSHKISKIFGGAWYCYGVTARSLPKLATKIAAKVALETQQRKLK